MLKKLRNKKGFTLAELLIVVAIIGVLVAISVPIFTSQLAKSRIATNQANARAAKSAAVAQYLEDDKNGQVVYTYDTTTGKASTSDTTTAYAGTVTNKDISAWDDKANDSADYTTFSTKVYDKWSITIDANGEFSAVNYDNSSNKIKNSLNIS